MPNNPDTDVARLTAAFHMIYDVKDVHADDPDEAFQRQAREVLVQLEFLMDSLNVPVPRRYDRLGRGN